MSERNHQAHETDDIDRTIGANVRAELVRQGLTQDQAAAALRIGQTSLSERLNGITPFRVNELVRLSRRFGIPLARLLIDIN